MWKSILSVMLVLLLMIVLLFFEVFELLSFRTALIASVISFGIIITPFLVSVLHLNQSYGRHLRKFD